MSCPFGPIVEACLMRVIVAFGGMCLPPVCVSPVTGSEAEPFECLVCEIVCFVREPVGEVRGVADRCRPTENVDVECLNEVERNAADIDGPAENAALENILDRRDLRNDLRVIEVGE